MLELLLMLGARARSSVSMVDTQKQKSENRKKHSSTSTGLRQPRTQHAWLSPRDFWVPGVWLVTSSGTSLGDKENIEQICLFINRVGVLQIYKLSPNVVHAD